MRNLNLLFNKLYFQDIMYDEKEDKITAGSVADNNDLLFSSKFKSYKKDEEHDFIPCPIKDAKKIRLKTTYPGLLAGVGYPHDAMNNDDAIKMGFSFDYTSGQPYIPGSTFKGVLRSAFRNQPKAVCEIMNAVLKDRTFTTDNVARLEDELFEDGDIFLDAVVTKGDANGRLVGGDFITPHPDVIKNPGPIIHMLRILPGVTFEFRFVSRAKTTSELTAEEKTTLYKALLMIFGIGAKTNLGYGKLVEPQ